MSGLLAKCAEPVTANDAKGAKGRQELLTVRCGLVGSSRAMHCTSHPASCVASFALFASFADTALLVRQPVAEGPR